jgi:hypothetical protein
VFRDEDLALYDRKVRDKFTPECAEWIACGWSTARTAEPASRTGFNCRHRKLSERLVGPMPLVRAEGVRLAKPVALGAGSYNLAEAREKVVAVLSGMPVD